MEKRIRAVRARSGLNMADFGDRIGISAPSVSRLESGKNSPAERTVKLICSTFGVYEQWLRTGEGEMFEPTDSTLLDELAREHDLDVMERAIIAGFLDLPHELRVAVKNVILGMADKLRETDDLTGAGITEDKLDDIIARGMSNKKAQ